ncbi:ABC transporter ATP-binding protein [Helcococcus ovis]|uniref:ABC transporter ATP-binding protein n=1 Tax=Helcococcus ovis TaxID=72026 RepID=A0A4V3IY61_9FIRM|nr:ABC transporter ATP-binding protein [Helcococcus ovis]TFF63995.1 ABC transporter ATP-binding protein [Helcococcus ovis]TFF65058.1 ABC transporter ATP-binding protein [Helcococcus ovis]TFF66816.1 ABC transporter ATP-binding protein [Helcococcus ovis]WNZ01041.1 ABC transporter ATP-binding protein [Helcococcus ovis]
MTLLQVKNLQKVYTTRFGGNKVVALRDVSFEVEKGEFIAIMGESGSGKSTLLNIVSVLDKATNGSVSLNGQKVSEIKDKDLASYRRKNLGFVFQDFNLLDNFSIKDNILLPLVISKMKYKEMNQKLMPLVKRLGIEDLINKFPYEVSGGQKQRAAVARALIIEPELILADEPTGALDSKSADSLMDLFQSINDRGQTILMVTHSIKAASRASRVLFIKDGKIFHQIYRGDKNDEEMFLNISNTMTLLSTGGDRNE